MFKSVFQGKVDVLPIIAKLTIAAAGANAVKKFACTTLDPFLNAKVDKFLNVDEKASIQPPFEL